MSYGPTRALGASMKSVGGAGITRSGARTMRLMPRCVAIAAGLLLYAASAHADQAIGSMPIAARVADLAAAAGVHRIDAATLPLDIVRIAFASPDGPEEARTRAAIAGVLQRDGPAAAHLPLPLSPKTWTARVLDARIADIRLASAIFASRRAALLYHGLMAVDPATLATIDANAALLDTLARHSAVTAVYARSLCIRQGRVVTPGDAADDLWAAIVGADPRTPAAFVAKLWSARSGRVAGFYDAIAHLDPAHQAFAIGRATDPDRIARARNLLDAITMLEPRCAVRSAATASIQAAAPAPSAEASSVASTETPRRLAIARASASMRIDCSGRRSSATEPVIVQPLSAT